MAVTLVLGGARSGKSAYAQHRAEASAGRGAGRRLTFVATAQAGDEEMAERIARHRADRDTRWETVEAPIALAQTLAKLGEADVVLVDCLTLWLSNVLLAGLDVPEEGARLVRAAAACAAELWLVSNEVGLGLVPDNALGRRFRDEAGRLNQTMAAQADAVVFVAAGLPLVLKPSAPPPLPTP